MPGGAMFDPYGCKHCGRNLGSHGMSYMSGVGLHAWEAPDDTQIKMRMQERRNSRNRD